MLEAVTLFLCEEHGKLEKELAEKTGVLAGLEEEAGQLRAQVR